MNPRDLLFFDEMVIPKIINIVYWLLLAGTAISGLATIISGRVIGGLLMIVIGAVAARVWCELVIVIFKIYESVRKIAEK